MPSKYPKPEQPCEHEPKLALGLCRKCYMAHRAMFLGTCETPGCGNTQHSQGLCGTCYMRRMKAVGYTSQTELNYGRRSHIMTGPCAGCSTLVVTTALTKDTHRCKPCKKEHGKARRREWYRNNPDKKAASDANNKSAKRHISAQQSKKRYQLVKGTLPLRDTMKIRRSPCAACGLPGPSAIDHVIPLKRGGLHTVGNVQPLCTRCNASKGASLMVEWRQRLSKENAWPPSIRARTVVGIRRGSPPRTGYADSAEAQEQTAWTTSSALTKAAKTPPTTGSPPINDATRLTARDTSTRRGERSHVIAKHLKWKAS